MRGFNPVAALQDLLEQCRVLVNGMTEGTGFFIAPGFIVSCAHVAGIEVGVRTQVRWNDQNYEAVVVAASADALDHSSALYAFPDLAVVKLLDPPDGHPCVWIDMARPVQGAELTAVGFTDALQAGAAAPRRVRLAAGGRTAQAGGQLLELVEGEINPGLSGGPVLNHAAAGVCAVVKATRLEDSPVGGGFAVPIDALRLLDREVYRTVIEEHDRFHQADPRWRRLSDRVEQTPVGEGSEGAFHRHFLGLLSALPDSPNTDYSRPGAFLAVAAPGTPLPERPMLTHRDVYTELTALLPPPDDELPYELAFCADLTRELSGTVASGAVTELRDHVLIASGQLGLGDAVRARLADAEAPPRRPSVIGQVRHALRDRNLYHVMVWRFRSPHDIVPGGPESSALPLPEALGLLSDLLAQQVVLMGVTPQRRGLIELILPREVLDENFADWRLWPEFRYWSLGRKYDLVVRPLERHEAPYLHAAWEERWRHLEGKRVGEALVCVCGRDRQRQATLDALFNNDPALAALALAGSPRQSPVADAYTVALTSGVPMMLWRRGSVPGPAVCGRPCGVPGRDSCPDPEFLTQAREFLSNVPRDDVPDRICVLRNDAKIESDDGGHIGEHVVLLWDDPSRRIPRTPLAPATPVEEGQPVE